MLECITGLDALRARITHWKRNGLRVGFVPTLGNLHAGHHALVRLARAQADIVVASIFVNPTQFGAGEDLARYPRTPKTDVEGLDAAGCHLAWMPAVETMYPLGLAQAVQVRVPGITDVLEGAQRPGHFDGVCTVVARLFNQVQPDLAAFGRKDYQQLVVVRHLVRDMSFAVEVLAGDTVREADGLAMSSRNQYLSPGERATAPELHQSLLAMREGVRAGHAVAAIESQARARLTDAGFSVDYATLRTPDLGEPEAGKCGPMVALVAARLGQTRLIDNLEIP